MRVEAGNLVALEEFVDSPGVDGSEISKLAREHPKLFEVMLKSVRTCNPLTARLCYDA